MTDTPPRVRLIWDFFGPDAEHTARHHETHLVEFGKREGVEATTGAGPGSEGHWMAWMIVAAAEVDTLRHALRPQRGLPEA